MPPLMAGQRRAIVESDVEDEQYDSEEIEVAFVQPKRPPLNEMKPLQVQNKHKRRRVLDCVLIPRQASSAPTPKLANDSPLRHFQTESTPKRVSTGRRPKRSMNISSYAPEQVSDGDSEYHNLLAKFKPVKNRAVHEDSALAGFELNDEAESSACSKTLRKEVASKVSTTSRPRRSLKRPSYGQEQLFESSDDEIVAAKSTTMERKSTHRDASVEVSDFEEDAMSLASSDSSSEAAAPSVSGASSAAESMSDSDTQAPTKTSSRTVVTNRQRATSQNQAKRSSKGTKKNPCEYMENLINNKKRLDYSLPPLHRIDDIFCDLTEKALPIGFDKVLSHLENRKIRVATMCSGTESPLLALQMVQKALESHPVHNLSIEHIFSAEIVPAKQAFIERNFNPPLILRDITEFKDAKSGDTPIATTAYSAKVEVPVEIDILLVGTSCVDASNLNSKKKGLNEGGESDRTWHGFLGFVRAYKPRMLIVENVYGADWSKMHEDIQAAGYETSGVYVDTKAYYLPQTRQRGYMVGFDKARMAEAGVEFLGQAFQSNMEKLQRYASSPVTSFLLPTDQVSGTDLALPDDNKREPDWSRCAEIHTHYRHDKHLGGGRPYTQWQESGSMVVPDRASASFFHDRVEREKDFMDIAWLRKARINIDARFKSRFWNYTQNVHMDEDSTPFGLIGCLTPRARPFASDAMRHLTSEETLILQGLPLDKISFTTETQTELHDLAGNAMSTTVIGAAIISALIPGYKMITNSSGSAEVHNMLQLDPAPKILSGITQRSEVASGHEKVDVPFLRERVTNAMRRCYCEKGTSVASNDIQRCVDCGQTTCVACGGSPPHRYQQDQRLTNGRITFQQFETDLRKELPLQIRLDSVDDLRENLTSRASTQAKPDVIHEYAALVSKAARQTFSLQKFRRTHSIIVTYQSPDGRLELSLNDHKPQWHFYVDPPKHLPGNDLLRKALEQSVAKATVAKALFGNDWKWRVPVNKTCLVNIQGHGGDTPSWRARYEMPDFRNERQAKHLTVMLLEDDNALLEHPINGTFQYLPRCGTACESLYKRLDDVPDGPALYLFLDPHRTGPDAEDAFVFATDMSYREYDEEREVIARVFPSWRPWEHGQLDAKVDITIDHEWAILPGAGCLNPADTLIEIWKPKDIETASEALDCHHAIKVMSCKVVEASTKQSQQRSGEIVDPKDSGFFSENAWMFEAMTRMHDSNEWHSYVMVNTNTTCFACAPQKPLLKWKLSNSGKTIEPYEDAKSAGAYESAIKTRPKTILVEAHRSSHDHSKAVQIDLNVNLASMAHRARVRLPDKIENVQYKWRLVTNMNQSEAFSLRPFRLMKTEDNEPYDQDLKMGIEGLFPNQRMSLSWMRQQEAGAGQGCLLEESEEATLPNGWMIELRAQATMHIKGGICADHPGYGKTILILALVKAQLLDQEASEILEDLKLRQKAVAPGLIPSTATLVVCPRALVEQWVAEAKEKLKSKDGIIAIKTTADLDRTSIKQIRQAKLVIASSAIFSSDSYPDRLAAFAGVPGPVTNSGRSYGHWLKYATSYIPDHLRVLETKGVKALQQHVKDKYAQNIDSEDFEAVVPSRRLRGKEFATNASKAKKAKTTKAAPSSINAENVGSPLFEMFFFNRVVCDEFHQCEPKELAAIMHLQRYKTWGLSGTPKMGDFYDIAKLGALFGVPLRIGKDIKSVMKQKNIRELRKEMTPFERFISMRQAPSSSMLARIHELHQQFLDRFVRRNLTDFKVDYKEHLVVPTLDLAHQVLYTELSQHLNSMEMRMKKGNKSKTTDRDARLYRALSSSETAEEALSKTAAFFDRQEHSKTGSTALDYIILLRGQEIRDCEEELLLAISEAKRSEPANFENWRKARIHTEVLGDEETVSAFQLCYNNSRTGAMSNNVLAKSKQQAAATQFDSDDEAEDGSAGPGSKAVTGRGLTSRIGACVDRLLVAKRSLRFVCNVALIKDSARDENRTSHCCNTHCAESQSDDSNVAVSAFCGHVVCRTCYDHMKGEFLTQCPAEGCYASIQDHHLLWKSKMGDHKKPDSTPFGAKIEAAMRILKKIKTKHEQAVLFVQYQNQLEEVGKALEESGISATVVEDRQMAGPQVEEFRNGEDRNTVIVLNASAETAAGLNLQNANNVIFLSPLLRDQQYTYDATMAQAIGRVCRHGQGKEVHVYRIAARDTIDVDILEHRERRSTAVTEAGAPEIVLPAVLQSLDMSSGSTVERMQLVQENGHYSLRPQSWLYRCGAESDPDVMAKIQPQVGGKVIGKHRSRVHGWEDFSSLIKFSKAMTEDDNWR